jgi:DNA-binding XRE family transcriptional regulator
MGRPTSYRAEYAAQALKLCKLGLTDKELAEYFEVSEQTLNAWKKAHPAFLESLKGGKTLADAEVASKLFHRATGYEHQDTDIRVIDGQIVQTQIIKHYPPDTTAAIFWLKNRQPAKWRDKPVESDPDDVVPMRVEVTVKDARKPDA